MNTLSRYRRMPALLKSGPTGGLVEQALRLMAVQREAVAHLGLPLAAHCRVASIRGDTLVLVVDGPAWAGRARFHARSLITHLNRRFGLSLRRSRVRVVPEPPPPPRRSRPPISDAGRIALEQTARSISDPGLRAALLRLSRRGRPQGTAPATPPPPRRRP